MNKFARPAPSTICFLFRFPCRSRASNHVPRPGYSSSVFSLFLRPTRSFFLLLLWRSIYDLTMERSNLEPCRAFAFTHHLSSRVSVLCVIECVPVFPTSCERNGRVSFIRNNPFMISLRRAMGVPVSAL